MVLIWTESYTNNYLQYTIKKSRNYLINQTGMMKVYKNTCFGHLKDDFEKYKVQFFRLRKFLIMK